MNPLGEDSSIMRTTTIPSVLDIISRNYNNRNPKFWCYEVGREYLPVEGQQLPNEDSVLTIALYGGNADFYTLKGMVDTLFGVIGLCDADVSPCSDNPTFHPGRTAIYTKDGEELGILVKFIRQSAKNYSIGTKVYLAKLHMKALYQLSSADKTYHPLPKFPANDS